MDRVRIVGLTINSCSDDSQCRPDTWWEYRSTHQLCTHQIRSSCGGNLLALSHWLIVPDMSGINSNDIMYDLIEKCWIALVLAIVWGYLKLLRELVWSLSAHQEKLTMKVSAICWRGLGVVRAGDQEVGWWLVTVLVSINWTSSPHHHQPTSPSHHSSINIPWLWGYTPGIFSLC